MPPSRTFGAASVLSVLLALALVPAAGAVTASGRLQIIHLDVGQGDGALIISPLGQVVLIDEGPSGATTAMGKSVVQQLQALGVTRVGHPFPSHYHSDHIGNIGAIVNAGIPIDFGWDRGGSYTTATYTNYVNTLGSRRRTMVKGQVVTLDSLSAHPVTIRCVNLAGAGISTTDENSLSLVLKVSYGEFDEVFGGDLVGSSPDVESVVGPQVGPVEAYKVHHHGSRYSTNANWLNAVSPKIGVISVGNGNSYGHPTADALTRLHNKGVRTYWTETGAGVAPNASWDKVANAQVVISATWEPAGVDSVRGPGFADTFSNSGTADTTPPLVALTAPDGGEAWVAGSTHTITWTASDDRGVAAVDLAYSTDGGLTFPNPIATGLANSGSYPWTVPDAPGPTVRVRASARDAAGNVGADVSGADFAIAQYTLAVGVVGGGAVGRDPDRPGYPLGLAVRLTAAPGAGWAFAGWSGDVAGAADTVTVLLDADKSVTATFADVAPPTVQLTAPGGGEQWEPAAAQDIIWTAADNAGVETIDLDYSLGGAAGPWLTIAHGLANSGSHSWAVPSVLSDSVLVRVTAFDAAHNAASDLSDSLFSIGTPLVAVETPAGELALAPPSPNPGRGATTLRFVLPQGGRARLEIADLAGRRIWLEEVELPAGAHARRWDGLTANGTHAPAGLYFVRLVTPFGSRATRLVWLQR
jgi:beta-lactamase superfamily II metal-dependent hydrolase